MKRFKDKTIIITGADSDIGRATAIRLAEEGANVALVGRTQKKLEETSEKFPQDNTWIHADTHLTITCDITDADQVNAMLTHVINKFGSVDVLVNTVGYAAQQAMQNMSDDEVLQQMRDNQAHAINICRVALPSLVKTQGNIINVLTCPNTLKPEAWSMHQTINIEGYKDTRKIAIEFAKQGVRVNSIDASIIAITGETSGGLLSKSPTAEDIAGAVAFLASEDAAVITGIKLPVDAGIYAINKREQDLADDESKPN